MFATEQLEPREAAWPFATMDVVPSSADPRRTESAIAAAGLHVNKRLELGTEWGEFAEERSGKGGRNCSMARCFAIRTAKSQFGGRAYDIMLGDCLWHVYRMIGKLSPRLYVLSIP